MIPSLTLEKIKTLFGEDLILPDRINKLTLLADLTWNRLEDDLQQCFFNEIAKLRLNDPFLHLFHSIPNGGYRDKREAAKLVATGMTAGIPDTFLPVPMPRERIHGGLVSNYYHGMYIEFKKGKEKPSEEQKAILLMLDHLGYKVIVTNSLQIALSEVNNYLGL